MAMILLFGAGFASDRAAAAISGSDVILPVGISQSTKSLTELYNQISFLIADGSYAERIVKINNLTDGATGFSSTVDVDITNATTYDVGTDVTIGKTDTQNFWFDERNGGNGEPTPFTSLLQ